MTTPIKIKPVAIESFSFYARSLLGDYDNRGNEKFLESPHRRNRWQKRRAVFTGPALRERRHRKKM
jgi:hypothetical protein